MYSKIMPWSRYCWGLTQNFSILPSYSCRSKNSLASSFYQNFSSFGDSSMSNKEFKFDILPLCHGRKLNKLFSNNNNCCTKLELANNIQDEERSETSENRWTNNCVLLSFFAGLTLGAAAKLVYDFKTTSNFSVDIARVKNFSVLPEVLAAKGFSEAPDLDEPAHKSGEDNENQNESSYKSIFNFDGRGSDKGPPKHRHRFNFIADVVERLSPSVAFIEVIDLRRLDANGNPLAVNNGSGVVVDSSGLIITNAHVVTGSSKPRSSKIVVRLVDGRELDCVLEDIDHNCDLALLRVNATNLTPASLGNSSELRPGEFVVAVGAPLALSNTITAGVVSSIARCAKDLGIRANDINYIQTDAAITFGNSGGPLVNLDGDVIGINSMKAAAGISFAIPVDVAKEFLAKSRERMKLKRSSSSESVSKRRRFLGITMLSLTPDIITELQARVAAPLPHSLAHGVLVWRVVIGSPAYHAGLQPGDVITQINGHDIKTARDVYALLERPADLTMIVHRGNQRYTVTVQPEE